MKRYRKRSIFGWELGRKQIQNRQVEKEDVYVHFIRQKDSEWSGQWVISFMQLQLSNKKIIWLLFKGLGQLCKSIRDISPQAFAHVLSLCHISVIFKVFQTFSLLQHLLWWSVVSDTVSIFSNILQLKYTPLLDLIVYKLDLIV